MGHDEVVVVSRVEDAVDRRDRLVHGYDGEISEERDDRGPHGHALEPGELRPVLVPHDWPHQRDDEIPCGGNRFRRRTAECRDLPQDRPQRRVGPDPQIVPVASKSDCRTYSGGPLVPDLRRWSRTKPAKVRMAPTVRHAGQIGVHAGQPVTARIVRKKPVQSRTHDMVDERRLCGPRDSCPRFRESTGPPARGWNSPLATLRAMALARPCRSVAVPKYVTPLAASPNAEPRRLFLAKIRRMVSS